MEIVTVKAGEGTAGVETGGDRTLKSNSPTDQAPPAPAVDPAAPAPATPTEAELEARRNEVMASMWGGKPAQAEPPATTPAPAPAAPAPAPAPAAAPATATVPTAPEEPSIEQTIRQTAEAVSTEIARKIQPAQAEPQPEPEPEEVELTPEDARDYAVFERMGQKDPSLAGKAEEFKKFSLARYEYEAKWVAENPGRQFNPDDAEHEEFYKQQPEFPREAYDDARIAIMVDEQVEQKVAAKLAPIEHEKALAAAMPQIVAQVNSQVYTLVEKVDPTLAALLKEGDQINLSKANTDRIMAADPIASEVLDQMIKAEALPMLSALERSLLPGNELQPAKNPLHRKIAGYVEQFEAEMKKAPEAQQIRNGRKFMPISDRDAAIERIEKGRATAQAKQESIDRLQQQYWSTSIDDVETVIVNDVAARAKQQIEQLDRMAQRKYKPTAPAPVATPTAPPVPALPAQPTRQKPPGVVAASDAVDTTRQGQAGSKSVGEIAVETHWRK